LRNLFLDKLAKLSSVFVPEDQRYTFEASLAVDGIYAHSLAHSKHETRPWWRVDLGDVHCIWAVNILNRFISRSYICWTNQTLTNN